LVKKQVLSEFGDQITYYEWFNEEEFTAIMVRIRSIALEIPVSLSIRQLVNAIIGEPDVSEYIVAISVSPIESIEPTDGLFNLTFNGGYNTFFVHYYAPERPRENPLVVSIHYTKLFEAVRTIHLDSAAQLWRRLFRPAREKYAEQQGVPSFRKPVLAADLRDFFIEHLDFIKHIASARRMPLQIIAPVAIQPQPAPKRSLKQASVLRTTITPKREMALLVAAD
jgi:hypothetical protein